MSHSIKTIYLVRHCQAQGQAPEAPLTKDGEAQAQRLIATLSGAAIERIVSSPYVRASASVAPLAAHLGLPIEQDPRLVERVLCAGHLPEWKQQLERSFDDFEFCLEGGESSRAAMERAVAVIEDIRRHPACVTLIATHGNLMTLLLKHFDDRFGFAEWQTLRNPDVYRVHLTEPPQLMHL